MAIPPFGRALRTVALCLLVSSGLLWSAESPPQVYAPGQLPGSFTANEPDTPTIVFAGDIMTWERSAALIRRHGPSYPFQAVKPLIAGADWAVGNLEAPMAERAGKRPADHSYRVPPFTVNGLREAGFDLFSLANNHVMDCGPEGLVETLSNLRSNGLDGFGAGVNIWQAARPYVVRVGGIRVAFVTAICAETYSEGWNMARKPGKYESHLRLMRWRLQADQSRGGVVVASPGTVAELVHAASAQADLVVACLHFGVRYRRPPTERQRTLAHAAIAAGADLVVGHHAHIWQPVEVYRGVPVFYGLGNLAFGSANRRADQGLLLRASLEAGVFSAFELFPVCTSNRDADIDYQPKVFRHEAAKAVIDQMATLSAGFGASIAYRDGRGVLDLRVTRPPRSEGLPAGSVGDRPVESIIYGQKRGKK